MMKIFCFFLLSLLSFSSWGEDNKMGEQDANNTDCKAIADKTNVKADNTKVFEAEKPNISNTQTQ